MKISIVTVTFNNFKTIEQTIKEPTMLSADADKIKRKIDKLLSHRSSTYDAHTRHQIDLQIAELRKSL